MAALIHERIVKNQRFTSDEAAGYVLQAAKGLAEAARQNVVHRDIKPSNLLVDLSGTVKIADFGISKVSGENNLTRTGAAIGTPSYVSPEQGRGGTVDGRSDLYSLGVVFYELLALQKPFEGTTANAVIYQHNYAEPRMLREIDPDISEAYQAVTLKLLQKDPAKRYQTADELVVDLERIRSGNVSITAILQAKYGTGADEMMRRYLGKQRKWVIWAVAGLLVATLGTASSLWWWLTTRESRALVANEIQDRRRLLRESMDQPLRVPPNAIVDLDFLAKQVGNQDPDVVRWRDKIDRVNHQLIPQLSVLDAPEVPDFALRTASETAINALTTLTGTGYQIEIDRWRNRLKDAENEIQDLQKRIDEELNRQQYLSDPVQKAKAPYLERLHTLAGADHPALIRWMKAVADTATRAREINAEIQRIGGTRPELDRVTAEAMRNLLREYRTVTGSDSLLAETWQAKLQAVDREIANFDNLLAQFKTTDYLSRPQQSEAVAKLETWTALFGADDPNLRLVQSKLAVSSGYTDVLLKRLAKLDEPALKLTVKEAKDLRQDYERFKPLADAKDPMVAWNTTLADQEFRIVELTGALKRLLDPAHKEHLSSKDIDQFTLQMKELRERQGMSPEDQVASSSRLADESAFIVDLHERLKNADNDTVQLYAMIEDVILFGRLAGTDHVDFQRWKPLVAEYKRLRNLLGPADQAVPIPDRAEIHLAEFAKLVGSSNGEVATWKAKLERVGQLREALAPMARAEPIPPRASENIEELVKKIGEFPEASGWRAKIARSGELEVRLHANLDRTCIADPALRRDYNELVGLTGDQGADRAWWKRHLAELDPPARPAWANDFGDDRHGWWAAIQLNDQVTLRLRWVPAGRFTMGSSSDEIGRDADETPVEVTLSRGFWLAETETTQRLWRELMGTNPSDWVGDDHPVERVSWRDASACCRILAQRVEGLTARLPNEAEWEYACRAGATSPFSSFQGDLSQAYVESVAWVRGSSTNHESVRQRMPNRLGLYDMHGNVWEWCADHYGLYSPLPVTDPIGSTSRTRNIRGGSWGDAAERSRAANRQHMPEGMISAYLGFRMAIDGPTSASQSTAAVP